MAAPGIQFTVNGNITGGTAPFTYLWSVKALIYTISVSPDTTTPIVIQSGGTTDTVTVTSPAGSQIIMGLLCCKVTDANGLVTYAYYFIWANVNT